jgi:hypothetical protein
MPQALSFSTNEFRPFDVLVGKVEKPPSPGSTRHCGVALSPLALQFVFKWLVRCLRGYLLT